MLWSAANSPTGRILALGDDTVFGYGRRGIASGQVGHRADTYHLWRRNYPPTPNGESSQKTQPKKRKGLAKPRWFDNDSLIVRAMALTPDKLLVAGPPNLGKKSSGILAFDNRDEALAGFHGRRGVYLQVVSTEDGSTLARHTLQAMPVFDAMSAADGKVFMALQDGTVVCWGQK